MSALIASSSGSRRGPATTPPAPAIDTNKPGLTRGPIWWSNSIFFVGMHVLGVVGMAYLSPWYALDYRTGWLCFGSWQLAIFGITIGYHRLWSHRAFTASFPLRLILAGMGCLGFQGSIKWWVLRHRLHHRFTDTDSDPYDATRGLFFSHMGWIFRKPTYPKMKDIDRRDLDADPVVRFQHEHYIPLTLALGLGLPTLIGWSYGDATGGFIWGGVVGRILIWVSTFSINSFAHYLGDQEYSEEVTARGNFLLSLVTGGEANHNFHHAFPSDYRNGPRHLDWDPTKWTIYLLHRFTPLVPRVRQTAESEILKARAHVLASQSDRHHTTEAAAAPSSFARWGRFAEEIGSDGGSVTSSGGCATEPSSPDSASSDEADPLLDRSLASRRGLRQRVERRVSLPSSTGGLPSWTVAELTERVERLRATSRRAGVKAPVVLLLHRFAVDVTDYADDHPGGVSLLRKYAVGGKGGGVVDCSEAFEGLNNHGWSARERMKGLRIAQVLG